MTDWKTNHDTKLLQAPGMDSKRLSDVPKGTPFEGTNKDGYIETTIGGLSGYILGSSADPVQTSPDSIAPEEFELFRGLVIRTAEVASTDPAFLMAVAYAGTNNLKDLGGSGDGRVGPFQFTAQEWHAAITIGPAKDEDPPLQDADRFEWRFQPRVAALLAADRVKELQAATALGRLPTRLELYFAQMFGPGAEQILKEPHTDLCKNRIKDTIKDTPAPGSYAETLAKSEQSIADALDELRTNFATGLAATGLVSTDSDEASKPISTGTDALARQAFDILVRLGWGKAQACGILANILYESHFNHTVDTGDGGKAYGLCQWHDLKTGQERVDVFRQKFGKDIRGSSFEEQVQFIDYELNHTHSTAGQKLKAAATPHDASVAVTLYYEIPHNKEAVAPQRAPQAETYFSHFAALANPPEAPAGSSQPLQAGLSGKSRIGAQKVVAFDKDKFTAWLHANKVPRYGKGQCAAYVRQALEAAGCDTAGYPVPAKDWGPTLIRIGFQEFSPDGTYIAEKGDIIIFEASPALPVFGHIAGYDGTYWVSDFQQDDMWPSHRAQNEKNPYRIYRFVGSAVTTSASV